MSRPSPAFTLLAAAALAACGVVRAGDLETLESKTALNGALSQVKELKVALAQERKANAQIAAALAESNEKLIVAQEAARRADLQTQADLPDDTKALQTRLLDALNDLRLAREENRAARQQQNALAEAVTAYLAADDASRELCLKRLQTQLAALTAPTEAGTTVQPIERSQLVAVKEDKRLLVLNTGRDAGSKVGTPFRIYRNDKPIASAVVVDVRPSVSGALILENFGEETPAVGDTIRLDVAAQ